MKGDRVEALVDTGQGVQTFEIVATRAGRRIEVVTSRGVVEVREVTRTGVPVRTVRIPLQSDQLFRSNPINCFGVFDHPHGRRLGLLA